VIEPFTLCTPKTLIFWRLVKVLSFKDKKCHSILSIFGP
jgi:hypothetical protein